MSLLFQIRKNLYKLIDSVSINHEPQGIKGERNTAVLISLEDWEAIEEMLYINSHTTLKVSLLQNKQLKFSECSKNLED